MKNLIYTLLVSLIIFSCGPKQEPGFEISGKTLDVKTGDVMLLKRNTATWGSDTLATAKLVDGSFVLKGKIEGKPSAAFIRFIVDVEVKDSLGNPFTVKIAATDAIIIENKDIQYESAVRGNGFARRKVEGDNLLYDRVCTPEIFIEDLATLKENYLMLFDEALEMKKIGEDQELVNEKAVEGRQVMGTFLKARNTYFIEQFNKEDNLQLKTLILNRYGIPSGINIDEVKKIQEELSATYGEDDYHARYIAVLIKNFKTTQSVSVGNKYKDISAVDLLGNEHKLSSKIGDGKYVLLEFWASWCAPCRKEIPNLKHDYAEYHKKGFDIFGISIDTNEDGWRKASKAEQLPWLNTLKISNQGDNDAQKMYNVSAIPANFLIGPDGKIVSRNLRGKKLTEKLAELLDK